LFIRHSQIRSFAILSASPASSHIGLVRGEINGEEMGAFTAATHKEKVVRWFWL
jgi:hypothetical protein